MIISKEHKEALQKENQRLMEEEKRTNLKEKKATNVINKYLRDLKKFRMQEGIEMAIKKYDWGITILENIKKEVNKE